MLLFWKNCWEEVTDLKKLLFLESNSSKEIAIRKNYCCVEQIWKSNYSENLTALKKCLLWRSRFPENVVVLKKLLHMREETSSFEKKKKVSYNLNICFLSQYFFLVAYFSKLALNSINLFQGRSESLQLKGPYLGYSIIGSSLGSSVIGSFLRPWELGTPHWVSKYDF